MSILTVDEIKGLAPTLSDTEATIVAEGLSAAVLRVAPCLTTTATPGQLAEAKMLLAGVVKRWNDIGSGARTSMNAGPFAQAVDTRSYGPSFRLSDTEEARLAAICGAAVEGRHTGRMRMGWAG